MYEPHPIDTTPVPLPPELEPLVEPLARNHHQLWARMRMAEGWHWGPRRNDTTLETPLLVDFDELPESEKENNRGIARETLRTILVLGGSIVPPGAKARQPAAPPTPRLTLEEFRDSAARAVNEGECLAACDLVDEALRHWPKDVRLRQLHALALARMGSHAQARDIILALAGNADDEETLGLVARTYKDLWLESGDATDLERAYQAYAGAYASRPERYWTGINAATLAFARSDRPTAAKLSDELRTACLDRLAAAKPPERYWIIGTLAEAALVSGDLAEAERRYGEASAEGQADLGSLASTLRNARIILQHLPAEAAARIETAIGMPGIAIFTGHRTDEPGRSKPRFPIGSMAAVAASIAEVLRSSRVRVGYASAAAGGDILFLETLQAMGGRTHVVLPCSAEQFLAESVAPCGPEWVPRFHQVLKTATRVTLASEERLSAGSVAYEYGNQVLYGLAVARATEFGVPLTHVAVWDGQKGLPGGAGDVIASWRSRGRTVNVIDPVSGAVSIVQPAATEPRRPDVSEFGSAIRAMIFADAYHFSRLSEAQVPGFIHRFIGLVASLVEQAGQQMVFRNTWGDGLFFVFETASEAGRFAIRLAREVGAIDRKAAGLPETIDLRTSIHVGPVYRFLDRIIGRPNFIGAHVNRTARIEPITPPGQVYGTDAFAALAALEAPGEFRCDYVGRIPLAKDFGEYAMYRIQAAQGKGGRKLP